MKILIFYIFKIYFLILILYRKYQFLGVFVADFFADEVP